ncbi:MAG: CamS family sex pheromone protein [Erysipelotrichaceae bacterium]
MKHKLILLVIVTALLGGCSSNDEKKNNDELLTAPVISGDYAMLLPYEGNDTRVAHANFNPSSYNIDEIGFGMLELSKKHFSPDDYVVKEGNLLSYDDLVPSTSMDDQLGLLGRISDTNTIGLNPAKNSELQLATGTNGKIENPTIIVDIFEADMMKKEKDKYELNGVSIAMVVNDKLQVDDGLYGKTVQMDKAKFDLYVEESARKLVSYLKNMPQVGDTVPIYVTIYNSSSTDETLPGSFIAEAYFDSNNAKFTQIDEKWYLFPSKDVEKIDNVTYTQFVTLKNAISQSLPENVSVIGKGKYISNILDKLNITVTLQGKTYNEQIATIQYLKKLLTDFSDTNAEYTIDVKVVNDTVALLQKPKGSKEVIVIEK